MMDDQIRAKEIVKLMRHFLRDRICRAEMWNQIENLLVDTNPIEILNRLPIEYKGVLVGLCFEHPDYLLSESYVEGRTIAIRRTIYDWCAEKVS